MPRIDPPFAADERTMLMSFLDYFRETMIASLDGLDEAQARVTPTEQANSLLGLISHLASVEHWWFWECFRGQEPDFERWGDPEDNDFDFKPLPEHTIADRVAEYRRQFTRSNDIGLSANLDDVAKHPEGARRGVTLRWILVHMIEETARHAGHADITRELIDGRTGF
jgi:uncharacterized damage-inducible protein DinB